MLLAEDDEEVVQHIAHMSTQTYRKTDRKGVRARRAAAKTRSKRSLEESIETLSIKDGNFIE